MKEEVLEFVRSQRVCAFAIEMMDGSPHVSTVHFAHTEDPLIFSFETNREYRKCEALFGKDVSRASLVIGFEEGKNSKTFQLDGEARLLKVGEDSLKSSYLQKYPEKTLKASNPKNVFFLFIPTWWRFTDWSRSEGKTIITSDGTVSVAGQISKI